MEIFDTLISKSLSDYRQYLIKKKYELYEELLDLDQAAAFLNFNNLINTSSNPNILKEIINPFYIGMGNPESKLLFFGQELAIELDKNKQSSLEGFFQEQLYHHPLLIKPESTFFNPYKANDFRKITRHSHTWGIYSKWVAAFQKGDSKLYKEYLFENPRKNYFEDHCFYTELYDVPSPNHFKSHTSIERENFFIYEEFKNFIESFNYILIGCTSFYKDKEKLLEQYFGIKKSDIVKRETHSHLNKENKPYIKGEILKTKNQKFAIFNMQFSSAWKYDYINEIVNKLLII